MPLVTDLDYSDEIAALPKHTGYSTLPARSGEQYVTLHYSGVDYAATDEAGELQRILDEAYYQMHHNYGSSSSPAYPDGYLYDVVVLSSGKRVLTRAKPQQLWHCGNATGNKKSYSVHLMLGPNGDATEAQWSGMLDIFGQLCTMLKIGRINVVGHNEWPRSDGLPQPSDTYRLLSGQSECPGKKLHSRLAAWRGAPVDPLRTHQIPAAHGIYFWCGVGFYDYYYERVGTRDGLWELGYPIANEYSTTDQGGNEVTVMPFERGWLKYRYGEGVRPALVGEALAMQW